MKARTLAARDGFSLVEVLVATVILAVGFLAMAATTGAVLNRIRGAGLETERAAAVQQITERLRSAPFGTVQPKDESDPVVVGGYRFWWSVIPETFSSNYMEFLVVSEGRGMRGIHMSEAVRDSFVVSVFRP